MEELLINIAINLVVVLSFIFGEVGALVLPRMSRHFSKKPFKCRPCFTFWLHLSGMMLIALIFQSLIIAFSGVLTAFIVFFIVRYLDSKKVVK